MTIESVWEVEPVREVADQECEGGERARANANESLGMPAPSCSHFIRRGMKRGPSLSMGESPKRQCRCSRIVMMREWLIEAGSPVEAAARAVESNHTAWPHPSQIRQAGELDPHCRERRASI
jgi:hypothetical protein